MDRMGVCTGSVGGGAGGSRTVMGAGLKWSVGVNVWEKVPRGHE